MPKLTIAPKSVVLKKAATPAVVPATYALPAVKSEVASSLLDYSILLFGQEKIGKTDLCSYFDDPFFMMFEPGAKALSLFQVEIRKWEDVLGYMAALEREPGRFRTIVWDTIDIAYEMCFAYVCRTEGFDHPGDEAHGKGWSKVSTEWSRVINRCLKLKRGVIFTSHAADKEITSRITKEKFHRVGPTMKGGAAKIIEAIVDIWIYAYYDGNGKRHMRIRGNEDIAAGHRLKENFIGIETISMGKDAEEAYSNLVAAFENRLTPAKVESVVPQKKSFKLGGK